MVEVFGTSNDVLVVGESVVVGVRVVVGETNRGGASLRPHLCEEWAAERRVGATRA